MTGRSVPLWIGATPDSTIPDRVKLRIWRREDGRCGLTGRKINVGDEYDFDHKVPLHLGGAHSELNIWPVLRSAHRIKSAAELTAKAKADRVALKHLGLARKSGRGFDTRLRKKMDGTVVPREARS